MSYSDYDKFKDKKKKKIFFNKDRDESGSLPPGGKQPIILAKPERDKDWDKGERSQSDGQGSSSKTATQTTFILKTRDNDSRAVSPCQSKAPVVLRKENDVPQPSYQIATKPAPAEASSISNPLLLPPCMSGCVKLVDDSLQICDGIVEFLVDQNDFTVVGILGEQSTGKSYIMSSLAGKPGVFKSQSREVAESSGQCTFGVDMFVTPSRLMLLDVQPVLSSALAERSLLQDKKYAGEFTPNETNSDVLSMQLAAFLLSVCHVVLVMQDWAGDNDFIRSLLDAEMLKPSTTTTSSEDILIEYFPHIVFIKNRASPSEFTCTEINRIQENIRRTLVGSQLHVESGLSISTGLVMPHLTSSSCRGSLNLYLLPVDEDKDTSDKFRGHPGFVELVRCLRHQILSAHHQPLTPTLISEKHWFHYASKTLENVKKSSLFMEFGRFLP